MFHVRTCKSHGRILSGELYKEIIKKDKKMSSIDIACWIILHVFLQSVFHLLIFFFQNYLFKILFLEYNQIVARADILYYMQRFSARSDIKTC